ncbi:unnamed protein product [Cochlearia groenlandica]
MCKSIFHFCTSMIAPTVDIKGLPKMSESLGSSSISRTKKSVGMNAFQSLTGMSSKPPASILTDLSASTKEILVDLKVEKPSLYVMDIGMRLALVSKSQKQPSKTKGPIAHGMVKLPRSPSFAGV